MNANTQIFLDILNKIETPPLVFDVSISKNNYYSSSNCIRFTIQNINSIPYSFRIKEHDDIKTIHIKNLITQSAMLSTFLSFDQKGEVLLNKTAILNECLRNILEDFRIAFCNVGCLTIKKPTKTIEYAALSDFKCKLDRIDDTYKEMIIKVWLHLKSQPMIDVNSKDAKNTFSLISLVAQKLYKIKGV